MGDIGETLVNTGKPANTVVDGLVKALNDKSKDIRKNAADKLGDVGVASQTAISTLVEALNDDSEDVRYNAVDALGSICGRATQKEH